VYKRNFLAALLIVLSGAMPSQAGYCFSFAASPPPGPGGANPSINYLGPNNFSGVIGGSPPFGIRGINTPLNSGNSFEGDGAEFQVLGNSGMFEIFDPTLPFLGQVTASDVGPNGGKFVVDGFLSSDAASFFGISPDTGLSGAASIQFFDPTIVTSFGN
jgi:hypothetical protein